MNSGANLEGAAGGAILEAVGVGKFFRSPNGDKIEVLRGLSMRIARGESVSLRGESGAGKTTLMNVLSGLESPSAGKIFWNAERVDNLSNGKQAALRSGFMGFVFQNYCLVPELNALQNVELAARICGKFGKAARVRAKELLEAVGLGHRAGHLPSQLSGGEKQRVAVARALVNAPRIILADEPTGNLDESTAESVMDMLLSLCSREGASLLLITHNPDFAKRTSRALTLSHGVVE